MRRSWKLRGVWLLERSGRGHTPRGACGGECGFWSVAEEAILPAARVVGTVQELDVVR